MGVEITESRFMDLFGNRVIVAVILDPGTRDVKILLQSYVGKATQFVESMLRSVPEASGTKVETAEYEGEQITFFVPPNETAPEIRYVMVNNILTFGFGKADAELRRMVSLIKETSKESLSSNDNYREIVEKMGGDQDFNSIYFSDFTKISGMLEDLIRPLMEAQPEQFTNVNIDEVSKNLEQLKMIGGKAVRTRQGINLMTYLVPNFEKMTPGQKAAWEREDQPIESLRFIPSDTLFVNTIGNLDLKRIWNTFNEQASAAGTDVAQNPVYAMLATIREFETNYGLDFDKDVVSRVGREVSIVFSGMSLDGPFPVPRLSFLVRSDDSGALRATVVDLLKKMLSGENAPVVMTFADKKIEQGDFTVVQTPLGEGLSPVIGNVDSWIVISTNAVTAQKLLKAYQGGIGRIDSNEAFRKAVLDAERPLSQCSFVNLMQLNDLLKQILEWMVQRKDMIPQAEQFRGVIDGIGAYAVPFLESLIVFDSMGFSSYDEGDSTVQEMNLIVKDL
jgi:hypothetical protein